MATIYEITHQASRGLSTPNNISSNNSGNLNRYELPGTGRVAFGPPQEIREIFHFYAKKQNKSQPQSQSNAMDIDKANIALENLNIKETQDDNSMEVQSNTSSKDKKRAQSISKSESTEQNKSKSMKINPTSSTGNKSASSNNNSNASQSQKPNPYLTNNASSKTNSNQFSSMSKGVKPSSKTTETNALGNAVGVGQTTGYAAAMAKMKAMGQDWAEEEDLPGFSSSNPSSLTSDGSLNKDVSKEANKALQRQKKLVVSKKKY